MKELFLLLLIPALCAGATLGNWDTTKLVISVNGPAYRNYTNPLSFNSGVYPVYYGNRMINNPQCTLVNMASGYGYVNTNGYFKFDAVDDWCKFNNVILQNQSNTSHFTVELLLNYSRNIFIQSAFCIGNYSGTGNYIDCANSNGKWFFRIARTGVGTAQVSSNDTIAPGKHHVFFIKAGDSVHIYDNGVRPAYSASYTRYTQGTLTLSTYTSMGCGYGSGSPANNQFWKGQIYFVNVYDTSWTAAQVSAAYALMDSTFYGLGGRKRVNNTMVIGRIPRIDSINTVVNRYLNDTVKVYGTGYYQSKGNGFVNIDSAGTPKAATNTSWDSLLTKNLITNVKAGDSTSFAIFNSDTFGDTTARFLVNISGPVIDTQPKNTIDTVYSPALFYVSAQGNGPLTYQWRKKTVSGSWANTGSDNDTLITASTSRADTNALFCVLVSDTVGTTSSDTVTLTLRLNDTITATAPTPCIYNDTIFIIGTDFQGTQGAGVVKVDSLNSNWKNCTVAYWSNTLIKAIAPRVRWGYKRLIVNNTYLAGDTVTIRILQRIRTR